MTSSLIAHSIVVATGWAEVELLGTPVDLNTRAVAIMRRSDLAGDRVVLKVDRDLDRARAERDALALLAGHLSVPQVLFTDERDGISTTALEFLVGDPIDRCPEPGRIWRDAGASLRNIHNLGTESGNSRHHNSHPDSVLIWRDEMVSRAVALDIIDSPVAERLVTVTDLRLPTDQTSSFIHGDASPQHFLQRQGAITGVIDFGDAGYGDPTHDLAVLTLWAEDQLSAVLNGYGTDADTFEALQRGVAFHRPMRLLDAALWSVEHDFKPHAYLVALYEELLKPVL